MANIAFIFHGKIKNRRNISSSIEKNFSSEHNLISLFTERVGHSALLAEQAVAEGFTHIICVGGDGSLNEIVNGIIKAKANLSNNRWSSVRLGVLPMGTGNDFAKSLNVSKDIEGLKQMIVLDSFKVIDLGFAEYHDTSGEKQNRYFINITDIGMGGMVAERLSGYGKWMGTTLTYQRAILSTLLTYKNQSLKATSDTFVYEGKVMNFIIANGKYFGSGLGIAPDAETDDGKFSVVIFGEISLLDYIKNLRNVQKCKKISLPGLQYKSAREVYIESPSPSSLPIDMDGEFIGYAPVKLSIVPAVIKFLC